MEQESTRGGRRLGAGRKPTTIDKDKAKDLDKIWENYGRENFAIAVKKGHRWALRLLVEMKFRESVTADDITSFEDYIKEHGSTSKSKELSGGLHQNQDQRKKGDTVGVK